MKALCERGLDTAVAAGGDHADARVVERLEPRAATRNGRVETVLDDGETAGTEVRVLVAGTWGLASTSRLDAAAAHHAAFRAIGSGRVDTREGLGISRERRRASRFDLDGEPHWAAAVVPAVATTSFTIVGSGPGP